MSDSLAECTAKQLIFIQRYPRDSNGSLKRLLRPLGLAHLDAAIGDHKV